MSSNAKLQHVHQTEEQDNDKQSSFQQDFQGARVHYNAAQAPHYNEMEEALILAPANANPLRAQRSFAFRVAQTLGILGSIAWGVTCFAYFLLEGGIVTQTPYELGIFIAGMLAPVAFYWMLLSYLQRNSDVQYYAESLRAELHSLFFPSEEDSRRVNKDIERMTNQAAELAASSRAVLKSISRTRQGLREEIKKFAIMAKKTEAHLVSLSDHIDHRTQIAGTMIEKAAEIESMMEKGAKRVETIAGSAQEKSQIVSENFDGTITALGLTVDAAIERLGGMNDAFGGHTRSLNISTEELSKETGRISAMIEDHIEQLQEATGKSVETIAESLVSVSDQKDILEETVSHISTKATAIAETLGSSVTQLSDATEGVLVRAQDTGDKIADKADLIAQSLDGLQNEIDRIDSVSELASHRLSEGVDTAINGSTQISDAVRRGVEALKRASQEASNESTSLIDATVSHIQQLKDAGQGNISSVETMVELLERSREQIDKAASTADAHVQTMTKAVEGQSDKLEMSAATLAEAVQHVSRSLEDPLRQVGIAIADADGRHEQIQQTLDRRVNELHEASVKATGAAETIRQSLKDQTSDIAALSGRMIAQSKSLNTELSNNKVQLTEMIDTTLGDMNRLIDDLETKSGQMATHSMKIIEGIGQSTAMFDHAVTKMQDGAALTDQALTKSQTAFVETSTTLENHIERAEERINTAHQRLTHHAEKIIPLYDRVDSGSEKAAQTLTALRDDYAQTTAQAMARVEKTTQAFDQQLVLLKSNAENTQTAMKSMTDDMQQKLDSIEHATGSASESMQSLKNAMETQSTDIHLLTDQSVLKMETIQKLVNEQFRELSQSVAQAVTEVEGAGLSFDHQSQKMTETAAAILKRFTAAGDEAQAKTHDLKAAAFGLETTVKDCVKEISNQMVTLNGTSEDSLASIRKTSDTMAIRSREIDAAMQSVLDKAKSYANDMRIQVRAVAEKSDECAMSVSSNVSALVATMDKVDHKTRDMMDYITKANKSLYDQSGRFVTAVTQSTRTAEQATEMFGKQTNNLLKASRVALEKAQEVEKTQLRVGRENFMTSARFVLESLHSLSIDFVRMIDGEIADKDWKSYQKGNISIFSTKLVGRLGDIPADKLRDKYAEDTEFRNYVQKFMRQFEDVLEQTNSVDRGAVLGTTFAASDVGKIYRYLAHVIGRSNQNKDKAA